MRSTCATPRTPLQGARDDIVYEPGHLFRSLARSDRRIGDDGQANHVDALNQRFLDISRKIGSNAGDRILDVVEGAIRIGLEPEDDRRHRNPVGDR
jgi:hypothetical protein